MNVAAARSFLFVPGHRPDRFAKAEAAGADVVVLDLEDAVGAQLKAVARENVRDWLEAGHEAVVRINAAGTPWFGEDAAVASALATAVMVPKAEDPEVLGELSGAAVIPLLETALGIVRSVALCGAPSVIRPAFGSVDLAAELGVDHRSQEALRHARSAVVLAAAATGRPGPIDGVTTALDDEGALTADVEAAITLGFTGKLCIHPRQVAHVNRGCTPSDADVRWARDVLAASADGSVAVLNGQMIDRPVLLRAERILARVATH
ncbi:HpcH/HpaI aldolase/citrate lyase family protein [Amycolatopsis saalfeldensis]|uniref:Citrate lyase subunit beta / citryl-CoA lyase n=1 Tax=Amycolatopsis saalfeldensis TaxID=394193 RepID=A0A1H8VEX1_9PSEU|nr:CoA ester lyase [Amycolatopsis saalfeldensis]SEP14016.1 citrate lyase subunit beta / citryl-CoA lyase [Amycolatopsis saalfeldensis]